MQGEIQAALQKSLVGDNELLKRSNLDLSEYAKKEGYCISLMQIVHDRSLKNDIKQAALIQLKNCVKAKWKPKNEKTQLTPGQKNSIRSTLISAIVQCAKQHKLIKIYRQVLTTVISYEYQTWVPLNQIKALLDSTSDLAPVFHCIIAICTNFQFSVTDKQKNTFNLFLKEMLPAVLQALARNLHNSEILWKCVHYEISSQIRMLTNDWMELIYLTISSENEEMQKKLDQFQIKNTPEFYYYHSKKWATRILMRFVQRHAKAIFYGKATTQNVEFSKFWYETYGLKLCEVIVTHLSKVIPTTKKIRYFQLKVIQAIVSDKPEVMVHHSQAFQYSVLISYMTITKEDNELATNDVVEFLRSDDDCSLSYSNIKRVATEVWNNFLQLDSKLDRQKNIYYPGPLFEQSINFMFERLKSEEIIQKQMGIFLFCQNRLTINRVPLIKQQIPLIISTHIVPLLTNPNIFIRARANQMIYEFGKNIKDVNIIAQCLEGVYKCLVQDNSPLVRIKAAIALNSLVWHPQAKVFIKDYLKNILTVYLDLIRQYDLEQIVSALEYFIGDFSESIGPFAVDLFKYLSGLFIKMFNKDIQLSQNDQYGSEVQLAASGCIKTMTQILQSPLEQQVRGQLEPLVLQLCAFLFTNDSYDYYQDMFFMLRVHLWKIEKISSNCWFFYQILIYFVIGIPTEQLTQIQNSPIPQHNKNLLASVKEGQNYQFLQYIVPILRNYLQKGSNMIISQRPQFRQNIIHLIIHLVANVYKNTNTADIQGQIHLDCGTILLVYLIQTFPIEMTTGLVITIWNFCKYNMVKGKTTYIKQITCQLIGVLLWKHGQQILQIITTQNSLNTIINFVVKLSHHLQEYQQKKRVILGICSYLLLVQNNQLLAKHANTLGIILFRYIRKNSIYRILQGTTDKTLKDQVNLVRKQQSEQDAPDIEDDDADDMWDEEYNEKHCSSLKSINELAGFKEAIQRLGNENSELLQAITASISPVKLKIMEELLEKALTFPVN